MSTPIQVERQLPSLSHSSYSLSDQQHSTPLLNVEQSQSLFISGHMPSQSSCSTSFSSPSRLRTTTDSDSSKQSNTGGSMRLANTNLSNDDNGSSVMKRTNKTHVPSACVNCKRAHLACDVSRPCKRCVALNKVDTCIDIKHKKRGRPKLKDKKPHPYNTHATGDAKTWVSNTQFLPPTTTNPIPSRIQQIPPTITMFLTINGAHCAKVSDECLGIMGYYPGELVDKSLFDYVPSTDRDRLQKLIDSLVDNAYRYNHNIQPSHQFSYQSTTPFDSLVTTDDPGFNHTSPEQLQCPAGGSTLIEAADMIHLKQRNGQFDLYNVKTYLGGGLGADLMRKDTLNRLYIVAFFTRVKSGACVQNDCNPYAQSRINGINNNNNNINNNNINNSINSNINSINGFSSVNTPIPTTVATIDPALLTMSNDNINIGTGKFGLLSPILSPRQQ
ncbi:8944_t:CDS:2, partial [Scutellospora calospora]